MLYFFFFTLFYYYFFIFLADFLFIFSTRKSYMQAGIMYALFTLLSQAHGVPGVGQSINSYLIKRWIFIFWIMYPSNFSPMFKQCWTKLLIPFVISLHILANLLNFSESFHIVSFKVDSSMSIKKQEILKNCINQVLL